MKKLLMLLALINTSVCFASSEDISVTPASLVTEEEWSKVDNREGFVSTDMSVNDLPSRVEYLAITPTADHNACQVKCRSCDGEEINSIIRYHDNSESNCDRLLKLFSVNYKNSMAKYRLLLYKDADITIDTLYIEPYYEKLMLAAMPVVEIDFISTGISKINVGKIILNAPRFLVYLNSDSDNVRVDRIVRCTPGTRHICLLSSLNYRGKIIPAGEYSFDDHCELIVPYSADEYAPTAGVPLTKAQAEDGTYFKGEVIKSPVSSELPGAFAASEEDDDDESSISSSASSKSIKPAVYD